MSFNRLESNRAVKSGFKWIVCFDFQVTMVPYDSLKFSSIFVSDSVYSRHKEIMFLPLYQGTDRD